MKKFITRILLFIPVAAIVYVALVIAWGELKPYKAYSNLQYSKNHSDLGLRINEARGTKSPDVLFLGSSHCSMGFDVRVFKAAGYSTFNFGSYSQSPEQTLILMQRYLKAINPKLVVYEVYPRNFGKGNIEGAADLISNDRIDSLSVQLAFDVNNMTAYNTLAYAWYDDLKNGNKKQPYPILPPEIKYIPRGYIETEAGTYRNISPGRKFSWQLDTKQREAFEATLALFRKNNIPYVLVFAPVPYSTYAAAKNTKAFNEYMLGKGAYYNYNGKIALNDSLHFLDNNHMNQHGVEIFNRELLKNKEIFGHKKSGL